MLWWFGDALSTSAGASVGVAERHARISVAADRGHLGVQTHLEEAAQSLVAEIVEAQVLRRERDSRLQHSTQLNFPAILASVSPASLLLPVLEIPVMNDVD